MAGRLVGSHVARAQFLQHQSKLAGEAEGAGDSADGSTMRLADEIGPYRIVRMLGRGAMGEVYLAERAGTRVAIKVVYHGPDPEDEQVLEAERVGAELQQQLANV